MTARILLTGFEPYAGRGINPAAEVVTRLHGQAIAGVEIIGHTLPVALQGLEDRINTLLKDIRPTAVLSLGLAPGTPFIRLERIAVNIADFDIPDNSGRICRDECLIDSGPIALLSSLPLRAIEQRLLEADIAATLSNTAGTYLCNATMYYFLHALRNQAIPSGFIHLPYLPNQVAELIATTRSGHGLELEQRSDLASMHLETMLEALRISIAAIADIQHG